MVEWVNALPRAHLFAVDHHIHGAEANKPNVRAVVHLHGAKVRPDSDGYPEDWYVPGKSRISYYPNGQDAAMLWYHDHALGITRLNVYAGLFGAYFIRDEAEQRAQSAERKIEIPLILCDRKIDSQGATRLSSRADVSSRRGVRNSMATRSWSMESYFRFSRSRRGATAFGWSMYPTVAS